MDKIDLIVIGKYGAIVIYLYLKHGLLFDEIVSALYPKIAKEIYGIEV